MTEAQWMASDDPAAMLAWLTARVESEILGGIPFPVPPSDRKLRLFACACGMAARHSAGMMEEVAVGMDAPRWAAAWAANVPNTHSATVPQAHKAALLREVVGNPFRPVKIRHSWLTYDVWVLSDGAYDMRCWETLPIIADALEDAGCDNETLLRHLRGDEQRISTGLGSVKGTVYWMRSSAPHVRGCWALDLLLGKS